MVGCKNCGGLFNQRELERARPPLHPWPLTAAGARMLIDAAASSVAALPACPTCGNSTLRQATSARLIG